MEIKIPYYDDNSRVSRSSLGWFKISPKYFKDKLDGKIPNESTPVMENGTMRHAYLLQQEEFKTLYRVLDFTVPTSAQQKAFCQTYIDSNAPTDLLKASEAFKANYVINKLTEEDIAAKGLEMALKLKSYIKWLRDNATGQKTMTWAQYNSLKIMKENVLLHKKAKELLLTNQNSPEVITLNEFHINWDYPTRDGRVLPCKSLIDRLIINHETKTITLIDIKTTISVSNFKKSFEEYDYGMQCAFYWSAIYWYLANELKINPEEYAAETYIVAIENGSNQVRVFDVPNDIMYQKTANIEQTLTDIDWHFENNLWDFTKEYYEGDGVESLLYDIS